MPEAHSSTLSLAATVLMLRDTEAGPEVFMIKRHQKMGFAAGALVFPGGRLDQADGDESCLRFCTGGDTLDAAERAMRVCAIRETFEESGILLAHDGDAPELLSGERARELQARYRDKMNRGETGIWDMAAAENLKLACGNLTPFAHWITPEGLPRRYDTHFYLIAAPEEQAASHDTVESVASTWTTPAQALADADAVIAEPGARLFDDARLDAEIEDLADLGDAFAIHDVEFDLLERRRDLVLDGRDLGPVASDLVTILDSSNTPNIQTD